MGLGDRPKIIMEKGAAGITKWVGSTSSVLLHSILFVVSFSLPSLGLVSFERMLLVLTTIVSLEAIYLSIFIQMSINMNNQNIEIIQEDIVELGGDIEELGEDIEELGDDIEELGEDIEELGEDIEEIQKDVDELQEEEGETDDEDTAQNEAEENKELELLRSIQMTLAHLQQEIELLKQGAK